MPRRRLRSLRRCLMHFALMQRATPLNAAVILPHAPSFDRIAYDAAGATQRMLRTAPAARE